jgi:uncharacterized protein (DUF697 family)
MSKREKANLIINDNVLWSMGVGLIVPIPLLDIAAITALQIKMLNQLSELYQVEEAALDVKHFIGALTGGTFARLGASLLKLLPGIGTAIGGFSMSIMSGASTYAVGQVALEIFESGSSLSNTDMGTAKEAYKEALEEGKQVASELKEASEAGQGSPEKSEDSQYTKDILQTLDKLGELKDKGFITEEEFNTQKQKLLDRL